MQGLGILPRSGRPLREALLPFRGNWNLPWVIQRYWRSSCSGLSIAKLRNSATALVEMACGRTCVTSRPAVLRVEPTNVCNLHCPRCSCGIGADRRPKGQIALPHFRRILEQNQEEGWLLRLDGNGEPTLHPQIFNMVAMAKSYGYSVSMSTNLCTERAGQVRAFVGSGLDRLVVAVDGSTQESYERYRVGGKLSLVTERLAALNVVKKTMRSRTPLVDVQFLDWGYNHEEIPQVRAMARSVGADKFEIIRPDWSVDHAQASTRPRRCFWLWFVLTVDWQLNYHSCTNAWTCPWPRLNLNDVPSHEYWNHAVMQEARRYNLNKSSAVGEDTGCNCRECSDMLVVNRPPGYVCK
jgi:hypothetical protein